VISSPKGRWILIAGFAAAMLGATVLLVVPDDGQTLVEVEGTGSLAVLALPLAVAALPLLVPAQHRFRMAGASGFVLVLASFISTVGIFFLPAAIALVVAWWTGHATPGTAV